MAKLTCEMCGGQSFKKDNDLVVCTGCGMQYSMEDAKKLLITEDNAATSSEHVEVQSATTVNQEELSNLLLLARRAKEDDDHKGAAKYYEAILLKNPLNWEAAYYTAYFKNTDCKMGEIASVINQLSKASVSAFKLILSYVEKSEQKEAFLTVTKDTIARSLSLILISEGQFVDTIFSVQDKIFPMFYSNYTAGYECLLSLGDALMEYFPDSQVAKDEAISIWKTGIQTADKFLTKYRLRITQTLKTTQCNHIVNYVRKVQEVEPEFYEPKLGRVDFTPTNALPPKPTQEELDAKLKEEDPEAYEKEMARRAEEKAATKKKRTVCAVLALCFAIISLISHAVPIARYFVGLVMLPPCLVLGIKGIFGKKGLAIPAVIMAGVSFLWWMIDGMITLSM